MDAGFTKAESGNLPKITADMVDAFYMDNLDYFSAEIKNKKAERASKETYGDKAIGYVQIQRTNNVCLVRGRVTPEHKIRQKPYNVEVKINETDETIMSAECKDCAASAGGCKHCIAFLFWLHRRSEEPTCTSVSSYWAKPALANVSMAKMDVGSIFGLNLPELPDPSDQYLDALKQVPSGSIFQMQNPEGQFDQISVYKLWFKFKDDNSTGTADQFLEFSCLKMATELCNLASENTVDQSDSNLWYELRFGRITASIIYESARCKTLEGSLLEKIMGSAKNLESDSVKRGKRLESEVLSVVSKLKDIEILKTGIILNKDYPVFGASPDGISQEYCIEIKCPSSEKTFQNYYNNGKIVSKFLYQLQMQMFFAKKNKGLFCVASPNFESNREVSVFEVDLDVESLTEILNIEFWKLAVYPALQKIY